MAPRQPPFRLKTGHAQPYNPPNRIIRFAPADIESQVENIRKPQVENNECIDERLLHNPRTIGTDYRNSLQEKSRYALPAYLNEKQRAANRKKNLGFNTSLTQVKFSSTNYKAVNANQLYKALQYNRNRVALIVNLVAPNTSVIYLSFGTAPGVYSTVANAQGPGIPISSTMSFVTDAWCPVDDVHVIVSQGNTIVNLSEGVLVGNESE